ncbi:MAG: DUF5615 family PIN-like protein [Promethearchaeota archaeon]
MKFLVDAMLGKLARFLRIFGYDTLFANDLVEFYDVDPIPDDQLLAYAQKSKRMIITKDYPFYKRINEKAIYLKGEGVYNYLAQLKRNLNLKFEFKIERARCTACNSTLKEICEKESIKDLILPETYNHYDVFFQCENVNCKKIYWKGSHIDDIENKLLISSNLEEIN